MPTLIGIAGNHPPQRGEGAVAWQTTRSRGLTRGEGL
jgi:hypothetical protein